MKEPEETLFSPSTFKGNCILLDGQGSIITVMSTFTQQTPPCCFRRKPTGEVLFCPPLQCLYLREIRIARAKPPAIRFDQIDHSARKTTRCGGLLKGIIQRPSFSGDCQCGESGKGGLQHDGRYHGDARKWNGDVWRTMACLGCVLWPRSHVYEGSLGMFNMILPHPHTPRRPLPSDLFTHQHP